jgi:hypothetical protein
MELKAVQAKYVFNKEMIQSGVFCVVLRQEGLVLIIAG